MSILNRLMIKTLKMTRPDEAIAYADEPLADEEWSIEYNTQNKVREELEIELKPSQRGQS